jgi:methionyl-tRNA formyltransferase
MKFIFFGSNQFSAGVLNVLMANGFKPELIVTVPNEAAGRDKVMTPPFIKEKYLESGIKIIQPASLKKDPQVLEVIKSYQPDFGVVAAYSKLIPQPLIDLFPHGILNVHPSLLPKWRGPSPIESAIKNGDQETGVTIMLLDEIMDHGQILVQEKVEIGPDEYFYDLYLRLAEFGGQLLAKAIPLWLANKITPLPQNHNQATFSKMLSWHDGKIDLNKPVVEIYNQIRALSYEPGCWIELEQNLENRKQKVGVMVLKILKAHPITYHLSLTTKLGLRELDKQLVLVGGDGNLLVLDQVQPQGKKPMTGKEFLNGYRNKF